MISKRSKRGVLAVALAAATAFSMLGSAPSAHADPKWPNALVGHGSDTTQDVVGALAGEESGTFYTPISSSLGSNQTVLNSWDATGSACVTPRAPGATIDRANGSGAGRRLLSRSIDGGTYGSAACGVKTVSGLIDFARSSSGPGTTPGTALTYIPFGRDAVSFGYAVASGVTPVTTLTSAQIAQIMTTAGGINVGGTQIIGCGIQTSSGTYTFWNTALGITAANEATGTAQCNAAGTGARLQENDGNGLKAKSDALPGVQVIVGFSAANYISQNNGVVTSQLPSPAGTVSLGAIDALGSPYVGSPGSSLSPNPGFYGSGTYGRDVYNVVNTTRLGGSPSSNAALKTMFVGTTSAVCQATSTIQAFGFLGLGAACGSTTLTGPLVA